MAEKNNETQAEEKIQEKPIRRSGADALLTEEVAKKYKVVGWAGGHRQHFGKHGIVDLKELSIRRADKLFKNGFKHLAKR